MIPPYLVFIIVGIIACAAAIGIAVALIAGSSPVGEPYWSLRARPMTPRFNAINRRMRSRLTLYAVLISAPGVVVALTGLLSAFVIMFGVFDDLSWGSVSGPVAAVAVVMTVHAITIIRVALRVQEGYSVSILTSRMPMVMTAATAVTFVVTWLIEVQSGLATMWPIALGIALWLGGSAIVSRYIRVTAAREQHRYRMSGKNKEKSHA